MRAAMVFLKTQCLMVHINATSFRYFAYAVDYSFVNEKCLRGDTFYVHNVFWSLLSHIASPIEREGCKILTRALLPFSLLPNIIK